MTILLDDNTPRESYTVAEGVTQTQFTVPFEFFDDADLNFYVDGTLKTLPTHYTVTGGNGSTGTINTTVGNSVTGIAGGSTVVITRSIALERTTDFPSSGAFEVATLNTELDRFTAIAAEISDDNDRSIHLADDDATVSMTLPSKANRLGKVLGFNATTGAVEAGPTIADVSSLSAITTDISTLADIEDGTDATDAIQTVAGISGDVTTVAGIHTNVTTVAGIETDITNVAADEADIGIVSTNINSVNTVATNIDDVITVANDLNEAVSELETVANDLNEATSEIDTVSNSIANVDAVGTNIDDVTTVAGQISPTNNIATVAGDSTSINTVAGDSTAINTVAGDSTAINAVANDATDIGNVSTNIDSVNTVAGQISPTNNIATVASADADITTVAGQISPTNNIATVAGDSADIGTVAGLSADIQALADIEDGTTATNAISNVGNNIANVNTVASNLASVNNFAEVYRISASAPTDSTDLGDLYFDTTSDILKVYGTSGWQNAGSSVNGTSQRYHYDITGTPTSVTGADKFGNTLTYDAGYADVYVNGVRMSDEDITITSGDTVTFASALSNGDNVDIVAYGTFSVASLNADNLDSGTVPSARVSGAYTGITTAGQLTFADNEKAIFGAGSDLQIWHNSTGGYSIIRDAGTGDLYIEGSANIRLRDPDGRQSATFIPNGSQTFYHANSPKLATTSTGIEVTGNNTPTINIKSSDTVVVANDVVGAITFEESDATGGTGVQAFVKAIANDSGNTYDMSIGVGGNTEAIRIDQSGNVGIGTSSPTSYANSQATLVIEDTINPSIALSDTGQSKDYFISALGAQLSIRYADGGGSGSASNITELIRMYNTGQVIMPNQPAFSVHKTNVDQTNIAEGSDVTITFNGERFDQNADFASSTFTAPVTGKYFLNLVVRLESVQAAVHYYALYIKTSNNNYGTIYDTRVFDTNSAYFTMKTTILADMDANDTAYAAILQEASGSAITDIDGDTSWTYFTGHLVC